MLFLHNSFPCLMGATILRCIPHAASQLPSHTGTPEPIYSPPARSAESGVGKWGAVLCCSLSWGTETLQTTHPDVTRPTQGLPLLCTLLSPSHILHTLNLRSN